VRPLDWLRDELKPGRFEDDPIDLARGAEKQAPHVRRDPPKRFRHRDPRIKVPARPAAGHDDGIG
jgi:hypothetical protein